jgi:hypothetical protein
LAADLAVERADGLRVALVARGCDEREGFSDSGRLAVADFVEVVATMDVLTRTGTGPY